MHFWFLLLTPLWIIICCSCSGVLLIPLACGPLNSCQLHFSGTKLQLCCPLSSPLLPHNPPQTLSRQFRCRSSFWSHLKYYSLREAFPGLCREGELTLLYMPVTLYLSFTASCIHAVIWLFVYILYRIVCARGPRPSIVFIMVYLESNKLSWWTYEFLHESTVNLAFWLHFLDYWIVSKLTSLVHLDLFVPKFLVMVSKVLCAVIPLDFTYPYYFPFPDPSFLTFMFQIKVLYPFPSTPWEPEYSFTMCTSLKKLEAYLGIYWIFFMSL